MAGQIRLFEKVNGLLVEVPPEEAAKQREDRRVSHVSLAVDVLWTREEEAARDAEEAEFARKNEEAAVEAEIVEERRQAARRKLAELGITPEDIKDAL